MKLPSAKRIPWRRRSVQRYVKRLLDIVIALFGLLVLSPLILSLLIIVRWRIGSPALFVQLRPGLNGRPFRMIKMRSMSSTCDSDGRLLPDEQRLTAFGRWLRSTSLDELPELLNVLKGEMSLVGPRPLLMSYLELYDANQARRHEMPPGITGWAAVNGRNMLSWNEKFQLDVWYIDHWSLSLDIKILCKTVFRVLKREGISQSGHATIEVFRGPHST